MGRVGEVSCLTSLPLSRQSRVFLDSVHVVSGSPAPPKFVSSTWNSGGFLPLVLGVSGKGWGINFSVDDSIDRSLLLRCLQFSFALA